MIKIFWLFNILFINACSFVPEKHGAIRAPSSFKTTFDLIQEKINKSIQTERPVGAQKALQFEVFNKIFGNQDLTEVHKLSSIDSIQKHNELIIDMLKTQMPLDSSEIPYVTIEEATKIYQSIIDSTVVVNKATYDSSGTEGYCFGRALIGHVEAVAHGLDPRAVKKIWTVGNWLHYPFHVAILLRGKEGWYAIDRSFLGVISAEEWIERSIDSEIKSDKPNMIFVTNGERFSLNNDLAYRSIDLFSTNSNEYNKEGDFYRGYFKDFFEELETQKIYAFTTKEIEHKAPDLFAHYEVIKKLQTLYPQALLVSEWKKVYAELEQYLIDNEMNLKKLSDIHKILKYRKMRLEVAIKRKKETAQLVKDVHFAQVVVDLDQHLESIYGASNPVVKKTLDKVFKLPINELDQFLKTFFSIQINRKLTYELAEYYFRDGHLDKRNPYFQQIVEVILKKDYFDEKTQELVRSSLIKDKDSSCLTMMNGFFTTH